MNNKKIYLSIGIISVIILTLSITYAWFKWTSNSTNITFNVEDLGITYTGDDINIKSSLYPTIYMDNKDNIIHNFSIKKTTNTDVYLKISLDIIELPSELNEVSFVWNLYKEGTSIAKGDFKNATVGSDLILTPYEMISNNPTSYTLYIWIDGTMDNPISMGNKSFSFKLKLESSQEDYTTKEECFSFNKTTNTITGYLCYEGNEDNLETTTDIVIPSSIDGVEVKKIGYMAFRQKGLTSVIIPDTVTDIDQYAFTSNNMVRVVIPSKVINIGNNAFNMNKLSSVVLNSNLKTIGNYSFANNKLTSIEIPDGVTTIGNGAFYKNSIISIKIPSSVTTIGSYPFSTSSLTNIYVDKDNPNYTNGNNNDTIIEVSTKKLIQGTKNTVIPSDVKIIGDGAFGSIGRGAIEIPDGVTKIEKSAFMYSSLNSIKIPDSVTEIEPNAFYYSMLGSVTLPSNLSVISGGLLYFNYLTNIDIPDTVTSIESQSLKYNALSSVVIPDNVTTISNEAFMYNKLATIYIGKNSKLTTLGANCFSSSSSVDSGHTNNIELTTIHNYSGKSLDWNLAILGTSGTPFIEGTITTDDGRVITITTD